LVDLKGGTTGQVLAKASGTDMDFSWVAQDDSNAIQNAIVDAKGDLIAASAADTPARLAVGNNGETLVADSSTSTGLRYTGNYAAGKNKIINGDFGIWQRGTSFSNPTNGTYCADRYKTIHDGTGATRTISQQAFTAGTAPVAGYEGQYFMRYAVSAAGTSNTYQGMNQYIEDVRTFAGQPVTVSFWAKADASRTVNVDLSQNFGSGGSGTVYVTLSAASAAVTTSWQRFTFTGTAASIAGKTIGTGSALVFGYYPPAATVCTVDIWGVQVEYGSVATVFQTATGTLQGELAACQRYFERLDSTTGTTFTPFGMGVCSSTTQAYSNIYYTYKRTSPSLSFTAANTFAVTNASYAATALTAISSAASGQTGAITLATVASGLIAGNASQLYRNSSATAYIDISAEL